MSFVSNILRGYFNYAYNPLYDLIVAPLNHYQKLQEKCVAKLELMDNDKLLCVGIGTGNEIYHILRKNSNVNIVGIDYSKTALRKAHNKAFTLGNQIEVLLMDARYLQFPSGYFDKVLCLHVMDFSEESSEITKEIIRVLKKGGQFAITFPSEKEGAKLGFNLLKVSIRHHDSGKNRIKVIFELLVRIFLGCVYLPLLLRPKRKAYSRSELEAMLTQSTTGDFRIEEDSIYQDLIVYGEK